MIKGASTIQVPGDETAVTKAAGPYPLTLDEIDRVVTRTSPGFFSLGCFDSESHFVVKAVGRSDQDVAQELKAVAADVAQDSAYGFDLGYGRFTYGYAHSPEEVFEQECLLYHAAFEQLDSKRHPARRKSNGQRSYCPIWQCAWNY